MTTPEQVADALTGDPIGLARTVVAAKIAYWDALRAFEKATAPTDWDNVTNNAVINFIDELAQIDNALYLDNEDLNELVKTAQGKVS